MNEKTPETRGSFTEGGKRTGNVELDPAAQFHGFDHAGDRHHVSRITHRHFLRKGHIQYAVESLGHLGVETVDDFLVRPVVIHIILDTLKIRAGHTAGIG